AAAHELLVALSNGAGARLAVLLLQFGYDALELAAVFPQPLRPAPFERDVGVARSVEQSMAGLCGQFFPGLREIDVQIARDTFIDMPAPLTGRATHRGDARRPEVQLVIGNEQIGVEVHPLAEAVAGHAHAGGRVE